MACIIKKKQGKTTYYYAVRSARVNGKPRIVWQLYLGTLEDIVKRARGIFPGIQEVDILAAGGIAALLYIAERIGLEEVVNKFVPKRNQGASVGKYLLVAILNRVLEPCSKLQMPDWYKETVLARLWDYKPEVFSSQAFWDNMDLIPEEAITKIQEEIAKNVSKEFNIRPQNLLYDTTNFFTHIASRNRRNTIAQRGKSKQKRNDLRQVGLALLVSRDFQIPLFHCVYDGNRADRGLFPEASTEVRRSYRRVFGTPQAEETTLIFDKGNVAERSLDQLLLSGQSFVCGVPKNSAKDVFKWPESTLEPICELSGTKARSCKRVLWKHKVKLILVYAESYFSAQYADLGEKIQKTLDALKTLNEDLLNPHKARRKTKQTKDSVQKKVDEILVQAPKPGLFKVDIHEKNGCPYIAFELQKNVLQHITETELGRTILATNHLEWSEKDVILAYRSLNDIEDVFKRMKNHDYLHVQPIYSWTDHKIKIHLLCCVLALLLATLAHKIVKEKDIDISLPEMLEQLSKVREVILFDENSRECSSNNKIVLSRMTAQQKKITEALHVAEILSAPAPRQ